MSGVEKLSGDAVHSYRVAGLSVASEIELPGAIPAARVTAPAIVLRSGAVPESLEAASARGPTWEIGGDKFLLHVPDVARFLLSGGREIVFQVADGAEPADVSIFLVGTVLGILLHQRGQVVLHASAVRVDNRAVLFCGPSGAGKSTLAAALAERGYPLVTDDFCAVTVGAAGEVTVQPDGRNLKLWAQAIHMLDLAERRGAPVRNRLEKYFVEPAAAFTEPLPVGCVYALREARPPHKAGIERPKVPDAALMLRRAAYRPALVSRMGQAAEYFHAAGAIANAAGIFILTRPLKFAGLPEVIAGLERHWRDVGLTDRAA